MKNLLGLLLILIICFTSCEGRKTQNQALTESIEEFKSTVALEENTFIPETYYYQEIDTTLTSGFCIYSKLYVDMDNSILIEEKIIDSVTHKTYARESKTDIIVKFKDEILFSETIDKAFVQKIDTDLKKELSLYNVFTEESYKNQTDDKSTSIILQFYNPNNDEYQLYYRLNIDLNKNYTLSEIDNDNQLYTY